MKRRWVAALSLLLIVALAAFALTACQRSEGEVTEPETTEAAKQAEQGSSQNAKKPAIPDKLALEDNVPQLTVYNAQEDRYELMDIESYVQGVLAGEMRNDWPMEALKAQAILARTFVLKFVQEKTSMYSGADVSTDIREAQAYSEEKINERIVKAVEETRGEIMSYDGTLPYAWFHAHAGGITELAKAGLEYKEDEPGYTQSMESADSDKAPTAVKGWTVSYSAKEVGEACAEAGVKTGTVDTIEIGEKGASGRAITLTVNGKSVSAPSLRLALGGTELKSTLLDSVSIENGEVTFKGKGYGHGVGLSQWGAYGMAEQGAGAEEIVRHYFKDVDIVTLWE